MIRIDRVSCVLFFLSFVTCCRAEEKTPTTKFSGIEISWKDNFLSVSAPHLPGGDLKIWYLEAFCRQGSTRRNWELTTVPHQTRLIFASPDRKKIVLETTVDDGIVLQHEISARTDEIDFNIAAKNPTDQRSQALWAQPCVRVGPFTGGDKNTYLPQCFIFLDGKLTRFPTRDWATNALYTPGQVWRPQLISPDDVNPRPLSRLVPDNGLIGCFSADEKMICAIAFEPYEELFQGVIACIHSDFRIGLLNPGETRNIRGKLYLTSPDIGAILKRYKEDFPEHAINGKKDTGVKN